MRLQILSTPRRILFALLAVCALAGAARADEPDAIAQAAGAYAAYRADVAALSQAALSAPGDLERSLDRLAHYNESDLSRGWTAYGALTAANSAKFKAGIASVTKRYGRAAVLRALARDPAYARRRGGYSEAISLILDAAAAEQTTARAGAEHVDSIASHPLTWTEIINGETRAAKLRALGAAPGLYPPAAAPPLAPHDPHLRLAPAQTASARRMATLAGLHLLDPPASSSKSIDRLLDDKPTRTCLHMQQLQFYQCVSVTRNASEAAQCMSEHVLRGFSACLR